MPVPGDELAVHLVVQNTGSLRIQALSLTAETPVVISADDLVCQLQSDPPVAFTFGAASVLQPGQVIECSTEYTVTVPDVEARLRTMRFTVLGSAVNGQSPSATASNYFSTEPRLTLELELLVDQCTQPMEPGKECLAWLVLMGMVTRHAFCLKSLFANNCLFLIWA